MTIILPSLLDCGVCNQISEHYILQSFSSFGYPDLDTRPSEMARSSIYNLIQRCHSCGYCSYDITKCKSKSKLIVASEEYQKIITDKSVPNEAASYLALAYEQAQYKDFVQAAWNVIRAAWICDDRSNINKAIIHRKLALEHIEKAMSMGQMIIEQEGTTEAIKIDLLRRSGMFEQAIALCDVASEMDIDDLLLKIIKYQISLIQMKDMEAHKIPESIN